MLFAPKDGSADELSPLLVKIFESSDRIRSAMDDSSVTVTTRVEQMSASGKLESTTEKVDRVTFQGGQERERTLVKLTRDGKDVTEAEKARRAEPKTAKAGDKEKGRRFSVKSPFAANERHRYRFWLAGRDAANPSRIRVGFAPKGKATEELNAGEAVVEASSGNLVALSYHPTVNPKHVKRMEVRAEYASPSPVGPLPSSVTIDADAAMLFMKKTIRTRTTFSDYRFPGD